MSNASRAIRKQLLILVVAIIVLHSVAITLDRIYRFSEAGPTTRKIFTSVWMIVSLVVVLTGLYRIRVARNAAARERR